MAQQQRFPYTHKGNMEREDEARVHGSQACNRMRWLEWFVCAMNTTVNPTMEGARVGWVESRAVTSMVHSVAHVGASSKQIHTSSARTRDTNDCFIVL